MHSFLEVAAQRVGVTGVEKTGPCHLEGKANAVLDVGVAELYHSQLLEHGHMFINFKEYINVFPSQSLENSSWPL